MTADRVAAPAAAAPPFLAACRREPAARRPIWILRQAGRYLPEYRALRERHDFLELMRTPELAAEVTLQPLRRYPLDAAILFADILTPVDGLGLGLRFAPGPVLDRPLRSAAAIDAVRWPDVDGLAETVGYVAETIRRLRVELPPNTPLIGFAGAPFTLFCYLVEGRGGKRDGFPAARAFLEAEPEASRRLLERLAGLSAAYLELQARAGAQALMLFDSWAGLLAPDRYRELALPATRHVFARVAPLERPRIYFPRSAAGDGDASALLAAAAGLPLEVLHVDWRTPLARARELVGPEIALQGNLAPAALHLDDAALDRRIDDVLSGAGGLPGHVFNLGDGIERTTDPEKVARLVERVHRLGAAEPER